MEETDTSKISDTTTNDISVTYGLIDNKNEDRHDEKELEIRQAEVHEFRDEPQITLEKNPVKIQPSSDMSKDSLSFENRITEDSSHILIIRDDDELIETIKISDSSIIHSKEVLSSAITCDKHGSDPSIAFSGNEDGLRSELTDATLNTMSDKISLHAEPLNVVDTTKAHAEELVSFATKDGKLTSNNLGKAIRLDTDDTPFISSKNEEKQDIKNNTRLLNLSEIRLEETSELLSTSNSDISNQRTVLQSTSEIDSSESINPVCAVDTDTNFDVNSSDSSSKKTIRSNTSEIEILSATNVGTHEDNKSSADDSEVVCSEKIGIVDNDVGSEMLEEILGINTQEKTELPPPVESKSSTKLTLKDDGIDWDKQACLLSQIVEKGSTIANEIDATESVEDNPMPPSLEAHGDNGIAYDAVNKTHNDDNMVGEIKHESILHETVESKSELYNSKEMVDDNTKPLKEVDLGYSKKSGTSYDDYSMTSTEKIDARQLEESIPPRKTFHEKEYTESSSENIEADEEDILMKEILQMPDQSDVDLSESQLEKMEDDLLGIERPDADEATKEISQGPDQEIIDAPEGQPDDAMILTEASHKTNENSHDRKSVEPTMLPLMDVAGEPGQIQVEQEIYCDSRDKNIDVTIPTNAANNSPSLNLDNELISIQSKTPSHDKASPYIAEKICSENEAIYAKESAEANRLEYSDLNPGETQSKNNDIDDMSITRTDTDQPSIHDDDCQVNIANTKSDSQTLEADLQSPQLDSTMVNVNEDFASFSSASAQTAKYGQNILDFDDSVSVSMMEAEKFELDGSEGSKGSVFENEALQERGVVKPDTEEIKVNNRTNRRLDDTTLDASKMGHTINNSQSIVKDGVVDSALNKNQSPSKDKTFGQIESAGISGHINASEKAAKEREEGIESSLKEADLETDENLDTSNFLDILNPVNTNLEANPLTTIKPESDVSCGNEPTEVTTADNTVEKSEIIPETSFEAMHTEPTSVASKSLEIIEVDSVQEPTEVFIADNTVEESDRISETSLAAVETENISIDSKSPVSSNVSSGNEPTEVTMADNRVEPSEIIPKTLLDAFETEPTSIASKSPETSEIDSGQELTEITMAHNTVEKSGIIPEASFDAIHTEPTRIVAKSPEISEVSSVNEPTEVTMADNRVEPSEIIPKTLSDAFETEPTSIASKSTETSEIDSGQELTEVTMADNTVEKSGIIPEASFDVIHTEPTRIVSKSPEISEVSSVNEPSEVTMADNRVEPSEIHEASFDAIHTEPTRIVSKSPEIREISSVDEPTEVTMADNRVEPSEIPEASFDAIHTEPTRIVSKSPEISEVSSVNEPTEVTMADKTVEKSGIIPEASFDAIHTEPTRIVSKSPEISKVSSVNESTEFTIADNTLEELERFPETAFEASKTEAISVDSKSPASSKVISVNEPTEITMADTMGDSERITEASLEAIETEPIRIDSTSAEISELSSGDVSPAGVIIANNSVEISEKITVTSSEAIETKLTNIVSKPENNNGSKFSETTITETADRLHSDIAISLKSSECDLDFSDQEDPTKENEPLINLDQPLTKNVSDEMFVSKDKSTVLKSASPTTTENSGDKPVDTELHSPQSVRSTNDKQVADVCDHSSVPSSDTDVTEISAVESRDESVNLNTSESNAKDVNDEIAQPETIQNSEFVKQETNRTVDNAINIDTVAAIHEPPASSDENCSKTDVTECSTLQPLVTSPQTESPLTSLNTTKLSDLKESTAEQFSASSAENCSKTDVSECSTLQPLVSSTQTESPLTSSNTTKLSGLKESTTEQCSASSGENCSKTDVSECSTLQPLVSSTQTESPLTSSNATKLSGLKESTTEQCSASSGENSDSPGSSDPIIASLNPNVPSPATSSNKNKLNQLVVDLNKSTVKTSATSLVTTRNNKTTTPSITKKSVITHKKEVPTLSPKNTKVKEPKAMVASVEESQSKPPLRTRKRIHISTNTNQITSNSSVNALSLRKKETAKVSLKKKFISDESDVSVIETPEAIGSLKPKRGRPSISDSSKKKVLSTPKTREDERPVVINISIDRTTPRSTRRASRRTVEMEVETITGIVEPEVCIIPDDRSSTQNRKTRGSVEVNKTSIDSARPKRNAARAADNKIKSLVMNSLEPVSIEEVEQPVTKKCAQCKRVKLCRFQVSGYPLCSEDCHTVWNAREHETSAVRACAQCRSEVPREGALAWETMDFCREECLDKYQLALGSRCANCCKSVATSSMGKFCVRFGYDIKQFCAPTCLEEYKKGLKVCSYCQKDISSGAEGFLAPVGDKGQFKNFCTQSCMAKYEQLAKSCPPPEDVAECAVCKHSKPVRVEVLVGARLNKLCSEPCFAAFKFVNKISEGRCDQCKRFFDKVQSGRLTVYFEDKQYSFCCKTCLNVYVLANRKIVSCSFCKVKKYNFDMIKKNLHVGSVMACSLSCLSQIHVSSSPRRIPCDSCLNPCQAQYKLTMSDGSIKNFCSSNCSGTFQTRLSKAANSSKGAVSGDTTKATPRVTTQDIACQCVQPVIPQVTLPPPPPEVYQQILTQPPEPTTCKNKAVLCKPFMHNKGASCRPMQSFKQTQTEESLTRKCLIPIPVPIYVPAPMHMFSTPFPVPVPFPLPVPVPIFIPTTRNSAKGIFREIKKIQEKIPTDPFEAELLMMAEMVAGEKKQDNTDSESDDGPEPEVGTESFSPEPVDTSNAFGEDVLQMALKMASELEEPAVDMESVLTPSTITPSAQPSVDSKNLYASDPDDPNSALAIARGRKRPLRGGRGGTQASKRGRRSGPDVQTMAPPEPVQPTRIEVEKPDANMCLKYTFGVNAWRHWVMQKNAELEKAALTNRKIKPFKPELLQLTADELNFSLCLFVKEVKKPNGQEYAPDTIYYLCLGIQQYLFENGRIDNIFTDTYYEKFTDCLDEVAKKFAVLYNDSQFIVTRVEEEHLWESKQLGAHSPHVLLSTLMFFNTKHFNLVTVEEHMQLSFSHIMKHWKRNPNAAGIAKVPGSRNVLLRFYPPQSALEANSKKKKVYEQQENEENPLRCPVKLYEFYLSKCPESVKTRNDVFYLLPERSCVPDSPVWYSTMALGKEPLMKMLHRIKMVKEINVALLAC